MGTAGEGHELRGELLVLDGIGQFQMLLAPPLWVDFLGGGEAGGAATLSLLSTLSLGPCASACICCFHRSSLPTEQTLAGPPPLTAHLAVLFSPPPR